MELSGEGDAVFRGFPGWERKESVRMDYRDRVEELLRQRPMHVVSSVQTSGCREGGILELLCLI